MRKIEFPQGLLAYVTPSQRGADWISYDVQRFSNRQVCFFGAKFNFIIIKINLYLKAPRNPEKLQHK